MQAIDKSWGGLLIVVGHDKWAQEAVDFEHSGDGEVCSAEFHFGDHRSCVTVKLEVVTSGSI